MVQGKNVIVIGGGPAGLAATYDLAGHKVPVTCLEADTMVGGISRTIEYQGFRFDIGGHRFFSKYRRINALWHEVLGEDFLKRPRLSRIYYNGKFFNYPLQPTNALLGLGPLNSTLILLSYLKAKLFPRMPEESFDEWVSNRFGERLFRIFFKTYTEKVWGIPCHEIQAEWAAQRIKGLSLYSAVKNALFAKKDTSIKTLINEFNYPRLGPGQMYETMARKAETRGAQVLLRQRVIAVHNTDKRLTGVTVRNAEGEQLLEATDVISSMPITELLLCMRPEPPADVIKAAKALTYRSLITVNLLLNSPQSLPDTWIYVHDPSVRMGRIQCFANWSPAMVPDADHSSLGLEYFCSEGDSLWNASESELLSRGKKELAALNLVDPGKIYDGFVVRMPKCYPVYDGQYQKHLAVIRDYLRQFGNLQLCGRYGLFKYNNMDHSMLTALLAVENVLGAKHDVWAINADDEYHEEESRPS